MTFNLIAFKKKAQRHRGNTLGYSLSFLFFDFGFCSFQDRVSLCSPGCPGTHSVDPAGLELRNPPASASQVLGLKWATMLSFFFFQFFFSVLLFNTLIDGYLLVFVRYKGFVSP